MKPTKNQKTAIAYKTHKIGMVEQLYKLTGKFRDINNNLERARSCFSLKHKIYRKNGEIIEDNYPIMCTLFEKKEDALSVFNRIAKWQSVKEVEVEEL